MPNKNQNKQAHPKEELAALRHSAAHLLGAAVMELWPEAKLTIGPSIDDGFYYDVDLGDEVISEKNFPKIEKKMKQLVKQWKAFEKHEVSKDEALNHYAKNEYKQELINEFAEEGKKLSIYQSGNFKDLCRGGHTEEPSKELKHFKLLSVAGAYWRGDENKKMLTRIYGTVFFSAEELNAFIEMREEAKKRDHKVLGPKLDLFTFSEKVGSGLPLWTPKGTLLRNLLDDYVQELRKEKGYTKVEIPHITKKDLYETSGHWQKFADELFKIETREKHLFAMKPMNCPHHTQIFDRKPHSYREMPQRYANTTMVYRDEQSGELAGLSRVRCITQDDAHVFCRENQVADEAYAIWDIIESFYKATGFGELKIRLSLHDPNNFDAYLGDKERWEFAENQLRDLLKERGAEYFEAEGEAAFYGPKIDFMAYDSLGREWQVATIQIDRNMPERFELFCINEAGEKEQVVMLHAAIMGSIERFMSILIEHHAGAFPTWLAPTQVSLLPIADRHVEFCQQIAAQLDEKGIRVAIDDSTERLSKKIRNAQLEKVPYMLVIGDEEVESNQVGVRDRKEGDVGKMDVKAFVERVVEESNSKKA
jgi:threonyl-tRNA synthetase